MALIEIGPGVDDPDDRLADVIVGRITHLIHAGAMAERTKVVRQEPARAAQFFGFFTVHYTVSLSYFPVVSSAIPSAARCGARSCGRSGSPPRAQSGSR